MQSMKLKFSREKDAAPIHAVMMRPGKDINFYKTLCLYCADNNVNPNNYDETSFDSCVTRLSGLYCSICSGENMPFWFWVE